MRILKINGFVVEHYETKDFVKVFRQGKRELGLTLPMGPTEDLLRKIKQHFNQPNSV